MSALQTFLDDWKRHQKSGLRVMFPLTLYRFGRYAASLRFWPAKKVLGFIYVLLRPASTMLGGLDLERSTRVGEAPHFIHGGNIQINSGAVIGDRVGIMHGVTLGTATRDGLPTVGDDCFLGCNCSVLGGVTIGDRSVVAANSLVLSDVPPDSLAIGVPAKVLPKAFLDRKESTS